MTLGEIIVLILPYILEGGLVGSLCVLATLKYTRKEAALKNDTIAIGNEGSHIATLREVIETVRMDAQQRKEEVIELRTMYEDKCRENEDLKEENTAIKMMMCVNMGCKLRKPMMGQGDAWYRDHCHEENIGCNYIPINQLLRQCNLNAKGNEIKTSEE